MVAGTVLQAVGTYNQGQFAKKMGEYNAKLAENEAQIARDTAKVEEERHRDNLRRFVGTQRAAGQGVVVDDGSVGLLVEETIMQGERDAMAIRYAGSVQAARATAEAAAERMRGKAAARFATLGAASSLLSGFGKAGMMAGMGAGGGGGGGAALGNDASIGTSYSSSAVA
jgi:hypothetical protein